MDHPWLSKSRASCIAVAALLSACAGPTTGSSDANDVDSTPALVNNAKLAHTKTPLYVLNSSNGDDYTVTVYEQNNAKYIRSLTSSTVGVSGAIGFASDAQGKLYFSQEENPRSFLLNIYINNGAKIQRTLKQKRQFNSLVIDSQENVYSGCPPGQQLCEYAKNKVTRKLEAFGPLAVDEADDVAAFQANQTSVGVYAPAQTSPFWIANGLDRYVSALAFDASGNLYVADNDNDAHGTGYVQVYGPNESTPSLKITNGIDVPVGIAIDSKGDLYVLNLAQSGASVSVYAQGQSAPFETITDGVVGAVPTYGGGSPIAIDNAANLYVANQTGSVTVYSPGSVHPTQTITKGITKPVAVAIGSN